MTSAEKIADELEALIRERHARVVGIGGPPGAGKTTIARMVVDRFPGAVQLSLDDFCWSKAERAARGLRWRAAVGSHDLDLLVDVLDRLRRGDGADAPKYSADVDDRVGPVAIPPGRKVVVLDGWLLGLASGGYERILDRLDLLVFIDVPPDVALERRFGREAALRSAGGGFSEHQMQAFWDEVLAPGIANVLPAAKRRADVVLAAS